MLGLGYIVARTATGGEDWVELGAIFAGVILLGLALRERPVAPPKRNRTFRRTPDSQW